MCFDWSACHPWVPDLYSCSRSCFNDFRSAAAPQHHSADCLLVGEGAAMHPLQNNVPSLQALPPPFLPSPFSLLPRTVQPHFDSLNINRVYGCRTGAGSQEKERCRFLIYCFSTAPGLHCRLRPCSGAPLVAICCRHHCPLPAVLLIVRRRSIRIGCIVTLQGGPLSTRQKAFWYAIA